MNVSDTETVNRRGRGEACWIGRYDGVKLLELEPTGKTDFSQIFDFYGEGDFYFWHMAFDARALIHPRFFSSKYRRDLEALGLFDRTVIAGAYEIRAIPSKLVEIKCGKKIVRFYDLKQFYGTSLDVAGEKFYGLKKEPIPKSWYNEMDRCLGDARRPRVLAYARRDLEITHKLSQHLDGQLRAAKIYPKKLISCASLARELFGPRLKRNKPGDSVNRAFEQSFFGGRIETRIIGRVGRCHLIDLGQAYPSVMATLPPLAGGTFAYYHSGDEIGRHDPDFITARVSAEIPANWTWGPLAVRRDDGRIYFPTGKIVTWVGKAGLKLLRDFKIPHKILEGGEYYCRDRKPLFPEIPTLYAARKKSEAGLAIKTALNSGYGICAERRDQYAESDAVNGRRAGNFFIARSSVYGSCTNFLYAAAITEETRCKIFRVLHAARKSALFAATDGVLISGAPARKYPGGLGEFGLEGEYSSAVILGAGRYILRGTDGENKYRLRGFGGDAKAHFARLEKCSKKSARLPVLASGTLREWAMTGGESDLNVLEETEHDLSLGDSKRLWPAFGALKSCWRKTYDSTPEIGE